MTKVRCERCGVVNLDGFVTYPFCAGCGARLPAPVVERVPAWKKPLGPVLWASLLCGGALALFASVAFLNAGDGINGTLSVRGQLPARARVGRILPVRLDILQTDLSGAPSDRDLQELSLRLSTSSERLYDLISVQPPPDTQEVINSGRYLRFDTLPQGEPVVMMLRPRQAGTLRVVLLVEASNQDSTSFRAQVKVVPTHAELRAPTTR